jgi:GTP-binding protein EngB required for normal cell division
MANNVDNTSVDDIFNFLEKGKAQIDSIVGHNLILVVGITGAGKSTLIQFLSGDNEKLISVEISPDTGKYIISDNNQRISDETVKSKTVFPEIFEYGQHNLVDCPGFSDTRSAKHDIAATYITKKLIEKARAVKIIFIVNYNSVQKAEDRLSFRLVMQHATTFLKNIDKYSAGIGFVVSKVENSYRKMPGSKQFGLVADNAILQSIAAFIEEMKSTLQDETSDLNTSIFKLLEIMLQQNEVGFKNLAIFRKPDDVGPISECELLQDGKDSIKAIIDGLGFVAPADNDFDLSISDASKLVVIMLNDHLLSEIAKIMDCIGDGIIGFYRQALKDSCDMFDLYTTLTNAYSNLQANLNENDDPNSVDGFINNVIVRFIDQVNIPRTALMSTNTTFNHCIGRANELAKKLKFFKSFDLCYNPTTGILALHKGIEKALTEIGLLKNWIEFLTDLYQTFSTFDVQCKKHLYNVEDLENWGKDGLFTPGIHITSHNFQQFMEKISTIDNVKQYKLDGVDEHVLKHLNKMLTITLKSCDIVKTGTTVKVHGSFVCLSDIPENIRVDIKLLKVFASNKIFIDLDIQKKGAQMDVVLIAPTIEVINHRVINLDGRDADALEKASAKNAAYSKKKVWFFFKKHKVVLAKAGVPGLPGGPAGHFFASCSKLAGTGNLVVTLNGGRGGAGQHGGKGYDQFYQSHGRNGADGGKKGCGGYAGEFTFEFVEKLTKLTSSNEMGYAGAAGLGGKGGIGRLAGKKTTEFPHGMRGIDNFNDIGLLHPETNTKIDNLQMIGSFKSFAGGCIDEMLDGKLQNFLTTKSSPRSIRPKSVIAR